MGDLLGLSAFERALADWTAKKLAAASVGVELSAEKLQEETRRLLNQKSHAKGTQTPSAPGEPPARISGDLSESVTIQGPHPTAGGYEARVGPTTRYGRIQELGGTAGNGATLPARPYLAPALDNVRPDIALIFYIAWQD